MRENPDYVLEDPAQVRRLVEEHPWALLVSAPGTGLVVSHLPVLVDDAPPGGPLVLASHLGRPDEERHELGRHPVLVVVQGPHGYVSPRWYGGGDAVPTWNYLAVHLHGTPKILPHDENLAVLSRTVDQLERERPDPYAMAESAEYADRIAHGTVGFRLEVTRVEGKAKLSQDKPPEVVDRVLHALETDAVHGNAPLADAMRRVHGR